MVTPSTSGDEPVTIETIYEAIRKVQETARPLPKLVRLTEIEWRTMARPTQLRDVYPSAFFGIPVELADPLLIDVAGRFEE